MNSQDPSSYENIYDLTDSFQLMSPSTYQLIMSLREEGEHGDLLDGMVLSHSYIYIYSYPL
jgi:hypothetical protein